MGIEPQDKLLQAVIADSAEALAAPAGEGKRAVTVQDHAIVALAGRLDGMVKVSQMFWDAMTDAQRAKFQQQRPAATRH